MQRTYSSDGNPPHSGLKSALWDAAHMPRTAPSMRPPPVSRNTSQSDTSIHVWAASYTAGSQRTQ